MREAITTLAEFHAYRDRMRPRWFDDYPLRAMLRLSDGRYQFGYEIAGYGTVVGYCATHSHKTAAGAEECGERFLAGKPARRWRRR